MRIWAVIPARSGSRRIHRKNLRDLCGKPLLAHTILSALAYGGFERTIVSTDCPHIRDAALEWGGEVPFLRPAELARDDTPTVPVVLHLLEQYDPQQHPDAICLLQATSPLRQVEHIAAAVRLLEAGTASAVVSVAAARQNPDWMQIVNKGYLAPLLSQTVIRPQPAPATWCLNGALYLVKTQHLLRFQTVVADKTLPLIMSPEASIDIDTEIDFKLAEFLMQERDTNACIA